ncbi:DNA polymerase III, delta prime subunit [Rhizobiales bacterium GAS191]|nr:DNA polymerase III, delta prime subunit [Rhizobiales bacterium GAS191]
MAEPKDRTDNLPHPRERYRLVGHERAELAMLEALRSHRLAHAWLIGGPEGIGKASFAYRVARFVLDGRDPFARAEGASSLNIAPDAPVARRIAAAAHPDLFVLERTLGTSGKLRTEITVDDARRATSFLQTTSGEGGYKVLIVDVADELNRNAANALLKIIEEPPGRSLALLVAHVPARLPATILSRCLRLRLEPLTPAQIVEIVSDLPGIDATGPVIAEAAALAEGSVKRALMLMEERAVEFARLARDVLEAPPGAWRTAALKLAGKLGARAGEASYDIIFDAIFDWLQERANRLAVAADARAEGAARLWTEIEMRKREADTYNLDKRALVLTSLKEVAELAL